MSVCFSLCQRFTLFPVTPRCNLLGCKKKQTKKNNVIVSFVLVRCSIKFGHRRWHDAASLHLLLLLFPPLTSLPPPSAPSAAEHELSFFFILIWFGMDSGRMSDTDWRYLLLSFPSIVPSSLSSIHHGLNKRTKRP